MSESDTKPKPLDAQFVIGSLIVGLGYTLIVLIIDTLGGKEAAGVAAVALSALATAILKEFEKMRFELEDEEKRTVSIPSSSLSVIFTISLVFVGCNNIMDTIMAPHQEYIIDIGGFKALQTLYAIPYAISGSLIAILPGKNPYIVAGYSALMSFVITKVSSWVGYGIYSVQMEVFEITNQSVYWFVYAIVASISAYVVWYFTEEKERS